MLRLVEVPTPVPRRGEVIVRIGLRPRSRELPLVQGALQSPRGFDTRWLSGNAAERTATVVAAPDAGSVPFNVRPRERWDGPTCRGAVVELYSQRM